MKKDLKAIVGTPTKSLDVSARTASADGASADLKGFRSAMVIIDVDAYTDGSLVFSLDESDDNSSWSAVASTDFSGSVTVDGAADDDQAYVIGYYGSKRYLRVALDAAAGATSGAICGGMIIPGHKINGGVLSS